ncbi:hypothetical protein KCU65_g9240, partial [Aureobasidium melanogenum]
MIVSVARHETHVGDSNFTYQFPLWTLQNSQAKPQDDLRTWITSYAADAMRSMIQDRLHVSFSDISVVWSMGDSGQLAVVNDRHSLCVAIMDHQRVGKTIIQLYVVKNSKDMTDLPKHLLN